MNLNRVVRANGKSNYIYTHFSCHFFLLFGTFFPALFLLCLFPGLFSLKFFWDWVSLEFSYIIKLKYVCLGVRVIIKKSSILLSFPIARNMLK